MGIKITLNQENVVENQTLNSLNIAVDVERIVQQTKLELTNKKTMPKREHISLIMCEQVCLCHLTEEQKNKRMVDIKTTCIHCQERSI